MRILSLDRDLSYQSDLTAELEPSGHQVDRLSRAAEALSADAARPFDLVICEARLADQDGLQFFRELKHARGGNPPPVIFLTDVEQPEVRDLCLNEGALRFLQKQDGWPATMAEIHAVIAQLEAPSRAGASASSVSRPDVRVFRGNLETIEILDIVQLLNLGRKTGVLVLSGGPHEGHVFFDEGEVVAASSGAGGRDLAAFSELLTLKQGAFRFEAAPIRVKRTIHQSTSSLMLDALRSHDEGSRKTYAGAPVSGANVEDKRERDTDPARWDAAFDFEHGRLEESPNAQSHPAAESFAMTAEHAPDILAELSAAVPTEDGAGQAVDISALPSVDVPPTDAVEVPMQETARISPTQPADEDLYTFDRALVGQGAARTPQSPALDAREEAPGAFHEGAGPGSFSRSAGGYGESPATRELRTGALDIWARRRLDVSAPLRKRLRSFRHGHSRPGSRLPAVTRRTMALAGIAAILFLASGYVVMFSGAIRSQEAEEGEAERADYRRLMLEAAENQAKIDSLEGMVRDLSGQTESGRVTPEGTKERISMIQSEILKASAAIRAAREASLRKSPETPREEPRQERVSRKDDGPERESADAPAVPAADSSSGLQSERSSPELVGTPGEVRVTEVSPAAGPAGAGSSFFVPVEGAAESSSGGAQPPAPGAEPAPDYSLRAIRGAPQFVPVDYRPVPRSPLRPQYPRALADRKIGGTVTLWVLVSAAGGVENVRVLRSSGYAELDKAAIDAVRRAAYNPARRDGNVVAAWTQQQIAFKLD